MGTTAQPEDGLAGGRNEGETVEDAAGEPVEVGVVGQQHGVGQRRYCLLKAPETQCVLVGRYEDEVIGIHNVSSWSNEPMVCSAPLAQPKP